MRLTKRTSVFLVAVAAFVLLALGLLNPHAAQATYYPSAYLASLHFADDWDTDSYVRKHFLLPYCNGYQEFFPVRGSGRLQGWGTDWTYHAPIDPIPRLINMKRDFQDDGLIDPEDNSEMTFTYVVSPTYYSATKYTYEGYHVDKSYAPNNQRPTVYFNAVDVGAWHVWEYWYYYSVNRWAYDLGNHEHDWEWYFVYFNSSWQPKYVALSRHGATDIFTWQQFLDNSKIEGGSHLKLGLDGGSNAFQDPDWGLPEGVRIQYAGYINQRQGRLDDGSHDKTFPWTILSNESDALGVTTYSAAPTYYYYDDPQVNGAASEKGDPNLAPWARSLWSNPPLPTP